MDELEARQISIKCIPNSRNSKTDKYTLYQEAIQATPKDARFLMRLFRRVTKRSCRVLREDFCGTAKLLCEFVRLHNNNRGFGIDIDPAPLQWCRMNNLAELSLSQQQRIKLIREDVLDFSSPKVDLVVALNFSHSLLKTRRDLLRYFVNVRGSLSPDGVFLIDDYGGSEVSVVGKEAWKGIGFGYVWEVSDFDPLTNHIVYKIHFHFKDGSRIKDAFVYECRLWTLPELREILAEAGFRKVHTLWESTDRSTGYGNGIMRRVLRGRMQGAWYAMLVSQL